MSKLEKSVVPMTGKKPLENQNKRSRVLVIKKLNNINEVKIY